jgi:hypothetical protein
VNLDGKKLVDHIDGDQKNNNVANLRWCNHQENERNKGLGKRNISGVRGVFWAKNTKRWRAQIGINDVNITIECYDSLEEAKEARIKKVNQLFGAIVHSSEKE